MTAAAITRIARRNEILRSAVVAVVVKVVDAERVCVYRVRGFPSDGATAPAAWVDSRAYQVIQDDPVNVGATVRHGEGMPGELSHSVPLLAKRTRRCIFHGPSVLQALVVQLAQAVRLMRALTPSDIAASTVPIPVDISVVLKAPVVHLAEALALIRLFAALHGADRNSGRSLERAKRVTVPEEANAVRLAVAVRIMAFMTVINRAFAHTPILPELRAASPGFYGATYCCRCMRHLPVGPQGEFTWIEPDGSEAGNRVGT